MKISFDKKIHALASSQRGFILPFTMLISTLVLLISGSVMGLLSKQLYFSKVYKQSQAAYYAADDAITCAIAIDDTYVGLDGLGIFPSDPFADPDAYIQQVIDEINLWRVAQIPPLPALALSDIRCAQVEIFTPAVSDFTVNMVDTYKYSYTLPVPGVEEGRSSSFMMRMPMVDDVNACNKTTNTINTCRCAKVTVNKTASFRQIIAQGYAQCDNPNGSVERAVVNTTVSD